MSELVFNRRHALQAICQANANGREWLYENYPKPGGRRAESRTGFLLHGGVAFPIKPLGRLANALAGRPMIGNPITNVFRAYFRSLDFELTTRAVDEAEEAAAENEAQEADQRQRRQAETWDRPGQAKFRRQVFELYGAVCLVTGCKTIQSLEAAHVLPVAKGGTDEAWNGIPLRADIHRLFDAGNISIDPDTWILTIEEDVLYDYGQYQGQELGSRLADPKDATMLADALRSRCRI